MSTIINVEFNQAIFKLEFKSELFNARNFYSYLNDETNHLLRDGFVPYVIENMDQVGISTISQIHPMTYDELYEVGLSMQLALIEYAEDYNDDVFDLENSIKLIKSHFDKFSDPAKCDKILSPIYNFIEIVVPGVKRFNVYRLKSRKRKVTGFMDKLLENHQYKTDVFADGFVKTYTIDQVNKFRQDFLSKYAKLFTLHFSDNHPKEVYGDQLVG